MHTLEAIRNAIDADPEKLCEALEMTTDRDRYLCPVCQNDGEYHETGDFSIEAGFKCHKCDWHGDGLKLIQEVKGMNFPAALNFARSVYTETATGTPTEAPTASRKSTTGGSIHATQERSIDAILWGMSQRGGAWTVTRQDEYRNADGKPFAVVVRFDDEAGLKTYRPIHPVEGGWQSGDPEGQWPIFNLQEVLKNASETVYITEGEKACEAGLKIGLTCTTSAHGAKSPERTDWTPLQNRNVVILPDNDSAGVSYAEAVVKLLFRAGAKSIKTVILPLTEKGDDLWEYVGNGGSKEELENLVQEAELVIVQPSEATEQTEPVEQTGNPIEQARKGDPYPMTDLGNAERLVAWFGDVIKWDVPRSCWRLWDGRRWKADTALKVLDLASKSARLIRKEAAEAPAKKQGGADVAGELWAHARRSESREKLSACVEVAKSISGVAVDASAWDSDSMLFNVRNGTIDLKTGKLKEHDKADMITRLTSIDYSPEAKCNRWESFLQDSTGGNAELIRFLQKASGYTLTGMTSEEVLFMVYGVTASGKTTFLETLKSVLGEYALTIDPAMLCKSKQGGSTGGNATPELARLDGVRLAGGSEMEQGRELAEAVVKNITGGETITARHLYSDIFQFQPRFKLWLALNHCPKASADDPAIWRRMLRIGFDKSVPVSKRDKSLKPYLATSGAGAVLAWAVKGCLLWQAEGLGVPECVQASTEAYRNESDPLANFFEDCISLESGAWVGNGDLQASYRDYCDDNGIKYPVSPRRIAERLKALGAQPDKRGGVRGWQGVAVLADDWHRTNDNTQASVMQYPEAIKKTETVDTLDTLDRTPKTFLHEEILVKSFNVSVQCVQSVQPDGKPQQNQDFQNHETDVFDCFEAIPEEAETSRNVT